MPGVVIRGAITGVVGIVLGIVGAHYLFVGSALSLIPWCIAGLAIGAFCVGRREALLVGTIYGFLLAFSFMLSGYEGSQPVMVVVPFFLILGLFGGVCGAAL